MFQVCRIAPIAKHIAEARRRVWPATLTDQIVIEAMWRQRIDGILQLRCDWQYARLVDEWVSAIGLNAREFGTHSLRRMKASLIYKATGNLRAVQILLGHSKIENTIRYLGVDIDDAFTLAEGTEI